jgi:hypothetical protein
LVEGDDAVGIPKPPSSEIAFQLYKVNLDWHPIEVAIRAMLDRQGSTSEAAEYLAYVNDQVLKNLNTTVQLYARSIN